MQQEGVTYTEVAPRTGDPVAGDVQVSILQHLLDLVEGECVARTAAQGRDPSAPLQFGPATRLMLAEQGLVVAGRQLDVTEVEGKPSWRANLRELWWQGVCIKRFYHDAPNQRHILDAFQKDGWPQRLVIRLPKVDGISAKSRLKETARDLTADSILAHPLFARRQQGWAGAWKLFHTPSWRPPPTCSPVDH